MKLNALGSLKAVLWLVGLSHIVIGLSLNLPLGWKESVATALYGATVDWGDRQFVYILKPLGAFMIALGIMAWAAARDPIAHRAISYGFVLLFTLRGLQRILFLGEIRDTFALSVARHFGGMIFMFLLATVVLALTLTVSRSAAPARERAA